MKQRFAIWLIFSICSIIVIHAEDIRGTIRDFKTDAAIGFANIYYEGTTIGTNSDINGNYTIKKIVGKKLTFSFVGYEKQVLPIAKSTSQLQVRLKSTEITLSVAQVSGKRKKYSRKENPAITLIRNVIESKKKHHVKNNDYFSYDLYRKTTFSINEITERVLQGDTFKNMPFLKDHVEVCAETGKLILPISLQEEALQYIYRKDPENEKRIITGKKETGINQLLHTGEIMNEAIKDYFTDVDIYQERVRLLQYPFISPISTHHAISFYHYFLGDTLMIGEDKCVEVSFSPANPQDFGFTGSLFITADTTYRVRRAILNIPVKSDINYINGMNIDQEFTTLPSGEQVLLYDKMLIQMQLLEALTKFQVVRNTSYSNYSTEEINQEKFKFLGVEKVLDEASHRPDSFWNSCRPDTLTNSEKSISKMLESARGIKHFGFFMLVAKAFIENFIETSPHPDKPNLVDFGPVNTIVGSNFVDGLRFRLSGQTTANLNKHLFWKGYLAYGCKDKRLKGLSEFTYAFNKREYSPIEFPTNNLSISYQYDVMSPSDKFQMHDKDNVFTMLKWTKVDQMMYVNRFKLRYEHEFANGFRYDGEYRRETDEGTGQLFYQKLNGNPTPSENTEVHIKHFNTSEIRVGIYYQPKPNYVNSKQKRAQLNRDSPIYTLYHTMGFNGFLGGEYTYNFTEATYFKRFWIPGAGKLDFRFNIGAQWNKVPYPLLIAPAANLSYILQAGTFSMIDNMEFLNDRYASIDMQLDLNGKLFNRIPLLRKLKWRECIGGSLLWGTLTDKNNPFLHTDDENLFYFPGRFEADGTYTYSSYLMDKQKPYAEVYAAIYNIFKVLHIQVVRRLNYLDNQNAKKWGFRTKLVFKF